MREHIQNISNDIISVCWDVPCSRSYFGHINVVTIASALCSNVKASYIWQLGEERICAFHLFSSKEAISNLDAGVPIKKRKRARS